MEYFPFFFALKGRRALIIGGGEVARRKILLLSRAGVVPHVVAHRIGDEVIAAVLDLGGTWRVGDYEAGDLGDCHFVIAAANDDSLHRQIAADCRARRIPVNVVDCPALCSFIFPAIIDRSPLVIAVSSSGKSPVLARRIRAQIESILPVAIGRLADFCHEFRARVQKTLPVRRRRLFWEKILSGGGVQSAVLSGDEPAAAAKFKTALADFARAENCSAPVSSGGEVYLIGAGPGEEDLFTFRGQQLLQQADVVVYDRLVARGIVELARRDAQKIFVGKRRGRHLATQGDIHRRLISLALAGHKVARLKGGDPFIFGRGGEEMMHLRAAGIPFQVVPGVSAANGCAAYAGIPLTHRGIARGVRFAAAGRRDLDDARHWRLLAQDAATLVFYMAGATLRQISGRLIEGGRDARTAAAVVSGGCTSAQQVVVTTLAALLDADDRAPPAPSPALMIVGEVVRLRDSLQWFVGDARAPSAFSTMETTDQEYAAAATL